MATTKMGTSKDPNKMRADEMGFKNPAPRVSMGNPDYPAPKNTQTVKTRGTGCAVRGTKSSTKLG